ncbi:D-arabinono-1,4-lactone oxidase [Solicola gregarius]|uniref:FAD-binding protein n=1 Tax=Solicola gregarius TaxID=2908642 RepID=A0AA46TIP0_9ACTN|nr:D-arabinono-1,4-lactone oxidase [Solicola gregarius]UYM05584.1 FAD-binding protein [Solicola gregarius]
MLEKNWSGTYVYGASRIHTPRTVDEVRDIVASGDRVRALGTRHSFSSLADSPGSLVDLRRIEPVPELDRDAMTVTVSAGVRYGELAAFLQGNGCALHNLGSLPHICVAGACATATHGSGDRNRCLAASVAGIEIVTGGGELVSASRVDSEFAGMVVALGALGIVTRVTLDIEPTYDVRQDSYVDLEWPALDEHLDAVMGSAYSVSMFTDWRERIDRVWLKTRLDGEPFEPPVDVFGARPQPPEQWATLISDDPNLTPRGGSPGPWSERLPHFRLDSTPSNGDEIQSEYFVDRRHAVEAIRAVREVGADLEPVLMIGELRTVAADTMWLSPAYGRDSLALHFTWRNDPREVTRAVAALEAALAPFDARPHWGKVFAIQGGSLARLYDRLDDFRALAERLDPSGQFRNAYVDRLVFGAG